MRVLLLLLLLIKLLIKIPPHLGCVATLPCDMLRNRKTTNILNQVSCLTINQHEFMVHEFRWKSVDLFVDLLIVLLPISNWVRRWKNCDNRSIFSKDMDKSIVSPFFDSRCGIVACEILHLVMIFSHSESHVLIPIPVGIPLDPRDCNLSHCHAHL